MLSLSTSARLAVAGTREPLGLPIVNSRPETIFFCESMSWCQSNRNLDQMSVSVVASPRKPLGTLAREVLAGTTRVECNLYVIRGTAEGAHLTEPWRAGAQGGRARGCSHP